MCWDVWVSPTKTKSHVNGEKHTFVLSYLKDFKAMWTTKALSKPKINQHEQMENFSINQGKH